jgi:hypothetical protein
MDALIGLISVIAVLVFFYLVDAVLSHFFYGDVNRSILSKISTGFWICFAIVGIFFIIGLIYGLLDLLGEGIINICRNLKLF